MPSGPSAIPDFYYTIFAFYEPFLCLSGFVGALWDPKKTHDLQAPWPVGVSPPKELPLATLVTVTQLAHVCALLGLVNFVLLSAARRHLATQPAIQEKIVGALLGPLLLGDVLHIAITLHALGEHRWQPQTWSPMLWCTIVIGFTLMIPRLAWWIGIGRYVAGRDGDMRKSPQVVVDAKQ